MTTLEKYKCRFISESYGKESQTIKSIEEMAELTKALVKERQGSGSIEEVIDELADVQIMTEQLMCIFDCHAAVDERIEYKLQRQLKRMGETGRWQM